MFGFQFVFFFSEKHKKHKKTLNLNNKEVFSENDFYKFYKLLLDE